MQRFALMEEVVATTKSGNAKKNCLDGSIRSKIAEQDSFSEAKPIGILKISSHQLELWVEGTQMYWY